MKLSEYDEIVHCLETVCCDGTRESLALVRQQFPSVSPNTLISIYSQRVQAKTKATHWQHSAPAAAKRHYERYRRLAADPSTAPGTVLIGMAKELDFSPALLARTVLERFLHHSSGGDAPVAKSALTKLLREPHLIPDPALSLEVQQCALLDSSYGPVVESIKHSIGVELEVHLKRTLAGQGLAFLGEEEMRRKGYDKTPDVKLQVPVAVAGQAGQAGGRVVVNWIESKASFGDRHSHEGYMRDQFWSYVNRFGAGLVIYWFGFVEELATSSSQGILVADDFPSDFSRLTAAGQEAPQ